MGAHPSAGDQGSWWLGKGVIMAAPPLAHHSTMTPCFYRISGFFRRLFQWWNSLLLSFQAVFSQPTTISSLGRLSKPHFPTPSPLSQQATHNSGWNMQRCGVEHACNSYFVLTSTDHLLHSPLIPWRSFSIPADFHSVREFFWVWGPPFTFSFPLGLLVPFLIPLFFFSSFFHSFRCPKSSTNVQQVLCGNCSICRWILDVLVRSNEFHILLFHHLDSSLLSFFFFPFLAALGLRCCLQAFSSCSKWGLLFIVVHGLLMSVASLVVEHGL